MKTLKQYIVESQQWLNTPAKGDAFAIELDDGTLIETYIIEVADDCILLDSTEKINTVLAEWAALEDTDEGDSGVIMETMGYGSLVGEEDDVIETALNPLDPQSDYEAKKKALYDLSLNKDVDQQAVQQRMKDLEKEANAKGVTEGQVKQQMHADAERLTLEQFVDRYQDEKWVREFWHAINDPVEEAKYQGREVPLGKPMAGDQKKFKVYVRDPATGNVKKVNFGHGGKTAKRLGQKTMRIRKSNPAARKSFRARHNCDNPGPRTKARYWSCRKW
jgi:hypothetical protein